MDGSFLVGARTVKRATTFTAFDPSRNATLEPPFSIATADDVAEACRLADLAFDPFRATSPEDRARFLEAIADQVEAIGEALLSRAMQETGLPGARLSGERDRTTAQLRLFAQVLREGRSAGIVFDLPLPERQPVPRPDLRQRRIGLGPVAVFGASNFPLAFSVGGGDTTSALAAGCPVVCKAHPAHPGTSALVGEAIRRAVAECGLPDGTFSLLQGPSHALGATLVADPRIKAVGFTGSRVGGLALVEIAQRRREPIPVYAEMSSINPVIVFAGALAARGDALAAGYVASLTLGAGQFCTNPGLVFGVDGPELDRFVDSAAQALRRAEPQAMLTPGIHQAYLAGVSALEDHPKAKRVSRGIEPSAGNQGRAAIFSVSGADFAANPQFADEVFGAASIVVRCASLGEILAILNGLEGQLTITLQLDPEDEAAAAPFLPVLERKAGRILANAWPTGVEVSYAMVHGGPFPATSDGRTTSVGVAAIERFLRPVCYQDVPDSLLPRELKSDNPLNLPRHIAE